MKDVKYINTNVSTYLVVGVSVTHLVKIFLQLLNATHVVLIFNAQGYSLRISTGTFKLKGSWISVDIFKQKLLCILP